MKKQQKKTRKKSLKTTKQEAFTNKPTDGQMENPAKGHKAKKKLKIRKL